MKGSLEKFKALLLLAGIEVLAHYEIKNQYWPDDHRYDEVRCPWFLFKTKKGLIEIGWRKRVISIDWKDTGIIAHVTSEEITKDDFMVHAWSYSDALKYLTNLAGVLNHE